MRKMVFGRKLSRGRKSREALFKSLIKALVEYGKITTTQAKAKSIVGEVDKLINLAKEESIEARRRVLGYLGNDRKITDLIFKIAPKFSSRQSGYTKMTNLLPRKGDMAEMVSLEWTEKIVKEEKKPHSAKATRGKEEKEKVKGKTK
jgi:large subunit ribosomal protein L17